MHYKSFYTASKLSSVRTVYLFFFAQIVQDLSNFLLPQFLQLMKRFLRRQCEQGASAALQLFNDLLEIGSSMRITFPAAYRSDINCYRVLSLLPSTFLYLLFMRAPQVSGQVFGMGNVSVLTATP